MTWLEFIIDGGKFPGSRILNVFGSNPKVSYEIVGDTEEEQIENIKILGQYMQEGREQLFEKITDLIEFDKENIRDMDSFLEGLFGGADDMAIGDAFASASIEIGDGESLLDVLETAGEWLAEFVFA